MEKIIRILQLLFGIVQLYRNPFLPVLDRVKFLKKKERLILLRNGLKFKVRSRTSDIRVITELLICKVYDKILLSEMFDSDAIGVDIGAHIGVFSVLAASKLRKGRIFSFEPVPENYRLLQENIRLNNLEDKIFPIQKAISARNAEIELLRRSDDDTGGGSLYLNNDPSFPWVRTRIEAATLLDIFIICGISHIDFLKVDCEGCEYEIFYAIPKENIKKISEMIIEYHTHTCYSDWKNEKEKLKNYLYELNFDIQEFSNYIYGKQKQYK